MYPSLRFGTLHATQHLYRILALITAWFGLFGAGSAFALVINIDFDQSIVGRSPSDGFSAASGQAGVWNQVRLGTTANLLDVDGHATGTGIVVSALTDAGTAFAPDNDAQRLLNDNFFRGPSTTPNGWSVTITGLPNTTYELFLYAPTNPLVSTGLMAVNGMLLPDVPGNDLGQLVAGQSWIRTLVGVNTGMLSLTGTAEGASRSVAGLAGLQLIPEPSTLTVVGVGLAAIAYRRRRGRGGGSLQSSNRRRQVE